MAEIYQLGGDPEFHIVNKRSRLVKTPTELAKHDEYRYFERSHYNGSTLIDGTAFEPWVNPAWCREEIRGSFADVIFSLKEMADAIPGENVVSFQPTVTLKKTSVLTPQEKVFGCQPEWNVYEARNQSSVCPSGHLERYQGGHIHVSFNDELGKATRVRMVKLNDYWTALPAIALMSEDAAKLERKRKKFYGQAGTMRFKDYGYEERWNDYEDRYEEVGTNGYEYRTLSTLQLLISPVQNSWLLGMIKGISQWVPSVADEQLDLLNELIPEDNVRSMINNVDVRRAREAVRFMLASDARVPYEDGRRAERGGIMSTSLKAFLYAAEKGAYFGDDDDSILKSWTYDTGHESLINSIRAKYYLREEEFQYMWNGSYSMPAKYKAALWDMCRVMGEGMDAQAS